MQERTLYYYQVCAKNGVVISLIPEKSGLFKIMYGEEKLGSYKTPQQAVDDLAGGHTFSPSDGADTSLLDIPSELGEWERKVFARMAGTGTRK